MYRAREHSSGLVSSLQNKQFGVILILAVRDSRKKNSIRTHSKLNLKIKSPEPLDHFSDSCVHAGHLPVVDGEGRGLEELVHGGGDELAPRQPVPHHQDQHQGEFRGHWGGACF